MPLATREIKRRLKSIANTKKITKAMELVAAAKMRKATQAVLATRDYANAAWEIVKDLSARTDPQHHPLLQKRGKIKQIGVIMFASNRGLCGGFNREIVELTAKYCSDQNKQNNSVIDIFLIGKRGREIAYKYDNKLIAEFDKADVAVSITEITPLAKMVIADYVAGKYDKVALAYTDYKSAISQKPRVRQLLPVVKQDKELGYVSKNEDKSEELKDYEYLFEPSPDVVLEQMLYRLIELQIYQALLESNASEHSARMLAMRNATDAAGDMIDDLTLTFNQARQQAITAEIAEISAGTAAVS